MDEKQPNWRKIGSLLPKSELMPSSKGSIPTQQPRTSATTGSPRTRTTPSEIGTGHGTDGAARLPTNVSQALATLDPEAADLAVLNSLPRSVALALKESVREIIDADYGWGYEITGYSLTTRPPSADLLAARKIVGAACEPASDDVLRRELTRLRVSTKARDMDADEISMTLQVILEEAIEYPADVAVAALRRWAKRETFFPALAEIRDEMQRLGKRRRALQGALV